MLKFKPTPSQLCYKLCESLTHTKTTGSDPSDQRNVPSALIQGQINTKPNATFHQPYDTQRYVLFGLYKALAAPLMPLSNLTGYPTTTWPPNWQQTQIW